MQNQAIGVIDKNFDDVRAETSFTDSGMTGIFIKVMVIRSPKENLQKYSQYTGKGPKISQSLTGLLRKRYLYLFKAAGNIQEPSETTFSAVVSERIIKSATWLRLGEDE
jgi:hypothetical protein